MRTVPDLQWMKLVPPMRLNNKRRKKLRERMHANPEQGKGKG